MCDEIVNPTTFKCYFVITMSQSLFFKKELWVRLGNSDQSTSQAVSVAEVRDERGELPLRMLVWVVLGPPSPPSDADAPGAFSRGSRASGCGLEGVWKGCWHA